MTKYSGWELLARILDLSVSAGIDVNDNAMSYEENEPKGRVRIYWYPDSPVSFYEVKADTVVEALTELNLHPQAHAVAARESRPVADYIKGS